MESTTTTYTQCISDAIDGTNVITVKQFAENLMSSEDYAKHMQGRIQTIDFAEALKSVNPHSFSWRSLDGEGCSGKNKSSIVSFYPGKGSFHGIGGLYGGMLLIQNIQSKFPTHAFSFEASKQPLLKEPLNELVSHKDSLSKKEFKDLLQLSLTFELFSDEKDYQSPEVIEQIKALQLTKHVMSQLLIKECINDLPKNPNIQTSGFISLKYDNFLQADVNKMSAVMSLLPLRDGAIDHVEIVSFDHITGQMRDLSNECKTIQDYITLLRNKKMDIVVYMDSVSMKKQGRDVQVMPKLRIHQIILHDYIEKKQQTIGLKLF